MGHMAHAGTADQKRADSFNPPTPRKTSVAEQPRDFKAPGLTVIQAKNSLFSVLRRLVNGSVLTPSLAGLVAGLALIVFAPTESLQTIDASYVASAAFVGRGLVVGSFVTGMFAWTQGMAAEKQKRDDLRVRIGFAGDLGRADLVDSEVTDVFLRGRKLSGARLSRARLHHGDFSGAEMVDTRMTNGSFLMSSFDQAVMVAVGAYNANFHGCSFVKANLHRAILCRADLRYSNIREANFADADLRDADLRETENIESAIFNRTWFSSRTRWPVDFNPRIEQGLIEKSSTHQERLDELIDLRDVVSDAVFRGPTI